MAHVEPKIPSREEQIKECADLLQETIMFRYCSEENRKKVARKMKHQLHSHGDQLIIQGEPSTKMFVLAEGSVVRLREVDKQIHQIDTNKCGTAINSLHVLRKDPTYSTAQCTTPVRVYVLTSDDLNDLLKDPSISNQVVYGLCREIRTQTKLMRTPLLETHPKRVHHPILINSLAAAIESFYRSALNSLLNQRLTGLKASLFPNMHIQIPSRIIYINGFKGIRLYLDETIDPEDYLNPQLVRLSMAISPALIMTPISSLLEASNAGHSNPEPMYRRFVRGYIPRMGREIIFGIGLNQMSDYCEERVAPYVSNLTLRNAFGSLLAGICAGYLSHVPHNLSTMKLMQPQISYLQHFRNFSKQWDHRIPSKIRSKGIRSLSSTFLSILFPKGVFIRTSQIVGSFIILNGTINALKSFNF